LGRHLSYLDLRLTAGVGVTALDGPDGELAPTVPLGGGVRLFLADYLALSVAVRDHLVFGSDGVQQLVLLTVGVALFVGERQRFCRVVIP
jgi:hypothetical protein